MKNFDNIKIISCDLDGTLLGPNGEPSDLTKE
ncbi:MAG: sugar/pyridoxal phosphate phosphatase YigL, partial [Erysipelotrichaceae bacterium]|nr:sugar/pyridoxal phosphate phosphatase YigL [Erysipelotrichaceae bacterium]